MADYLRLHFDVNSNSKIFCDEGTVQALSGIPADRFVTSVNAPGNHDDFVRFLIDHKVRFLVYVKQPGTTLPKIFPNGVPVEPDGFEFVMRGNAAFLPADIRVFERHLY